MADVIGKWSSRTFGGANSYACVSRPSLMQSHRDVGLGQERDPMVPWRWRPPDSPQHFTHFQFVNMELCLSCGKHESGGFVLVQS